MTYPGGKSGSGIYQKIINQIPPHDEYIECFAGDLAVMRAKKSAIINIAIDADASCTQRLANDLHGVTVINADAISYLQKKRCTIGTFVYADPPYLFAVRSSKRPMYKCEFGTVEQHTQLLLVLKSLPCMVAVSGYWSSLYAEMLQGWRSITFQSRTRSGRMATEWLWMNYPEPIELHDYRYLGENFRERERLKRIRTRWLARLGRMDRLERLMLSAAIAGNSGTEASP